MDSKERFFSLGDEIGFMDFRDNFHIYQLKKGRSPLLKWEEFLIFIFIFISDLKLAC
jgi:hypothetical protein